MIPNATDSNLFRTQDPSVQRAAGGTAPAAKANLDDYNPFDKTKASTTNGPGDSAAVMDTAPPQYTTSGQQQVSAADFQVRTHIMPHDCFDFVRCVTANTVYVMKVFPLVSSHFPQRISLRILFRNYRYTQQTTSFLPFLIPLPFPVVPVVLPD